MFGEIALTGLMAFSPIGNTTELDKIEYKPTNELHSVSDLNYELLLRDREYLEKNGNNFELIMNSDSTQTTKVPNLNNRALIIFKSLIKNEIIDFDEEQHYFSFLRDLKNQEEEYSKFLVDALIENNDKTCNAISLFLSQRKYKLISFEEEQFILQLLKNGDLSTQSFALEAILNWNEISDVNVLKEIVIPNKYLQEDLEEFILQRS